MMLFAATSDVRITAYVFVPWVSDQSLWREGEEFSLLKNMSNNKKVIKGRRVSTPVLSNAFALEEPNSCEGPPEVLLPRHLTLDNLAHERIPQCELGKLKLILCLYCYGKQDRNSLDA